MGRSSYWILFLICLSRLLKVLSSLLHASRGLWGAISMRTHPVLVGRSTSCKQILTWAETGAQTRVHTGKELGGSFSAYRKLDVLSWWKTSMRRIHIEPVNVTIYPIKSASGALVSALGSSACPPALVLVLRWGSERRLHCSLELGFNQYSSVGLAISCQWESHWDSSMLLKNIV